MVQVPRDERCNVKAYRLALLGAAGAAVFARLARGRASTVTMHELDWPGGGEAAWRRRYRSAGHLSHHLIELAGLAAPVFEVYVLRALEPAFREQVMVVTAAANDCSP